MTKPLRLLPLADVPLAQSRVFRVPTAAAAWTTLILGAIVGVSLWGGWRGGIPLGARDGIPGFLAWWIAAWLGLFWVFFANNLRKALKPAAWLAAVGGGGVYLKWRSYQNMAWGPDGPQVVFVPWGSIARAREHRHWSVTPADRGGTRHEHHAFVELQLAGADTAALEQHLALERDGRPGGVKHSTTWRHFPLTVEPGGLLRLEWRSRRGRRAFLEHLAKHGIPVAAARSSTADLSRGPSEEALRELARRGDSMGIIRSLRRHDGLSLEEATAKAEALMREIDS